MSSGFSSPTPTPRMSEGSEIYPSAEWDEQEATPIVKMRARYLAAIKLPR